MTMLSNSPPPVTSIEGASFCSTREPGDYFAPFVHAVTAEERADWAMGTNDFEFVLVSSEGVWLLEYWYGDPKQLGPSRLICGPVTSMLLFINRIDLSTCNAYNPAPSCSPAPRGQISPTCTGRIPGDHFEEFIYTPSPEERERWGLTGVYANDDLLISPDGGRVILFQWPGGLAMEEEVSICGIDTMYVFEGYTHPNTCTALDTAAVSG